MLKHVVFFKFKPEAGETEIADLQNSLRALPAVIPEIREFIVGRDVVRSERSYDLALISAFDDLAAMGRYQVHPDHQAVIAKVKTLCSGVVAVDFDY
jgi:quinol monooxygenase YgiN